VECFGEITEQFTERIDENIRETTDRLLASNPPIQRKRAVNSAETSLSSKSRKVEDGQKPVSEELTALQKLIEEAKNISKQSAEIFNTVVTNNNPSF
jgi:hypothetical protein